MSVKLPSDFGNEISKALNWKLEQVAEWFTLEEDKEGFFWARLKPKKILDKPEFKKMCTLVRNLGGEEYRVGAFAWKIPGPYAKKTNTASTPGPAGDARSKTSEQRVDSQRIYKEPGNAMPSGVPPRSVTDDKRKPPKLGPVFTVLPIKALLSMPFQSRVNLEGQSFADLVESVKTVGILEPILVREKPGGLYEIVAGERRVAAAKKVGLTEVPAIVKILSDQEAYEIQLVENVQREDLTDMEKARMLDMMLKKPGEHERQCRSEMRVHFRENAWNMDADKRKVA